jgi:hypothetical protein
MSDHTDAATMTPAAKPSSALWMRDETLRRANNTVEAPTTVPKNGMTTTLRIFIATYITKRVPYNEVGLTKM